MIWIIPTIIVLHQFWLYRVRGRFDPLALETMVDLVLLVICAWGAFVDPRSGYLLSNDAGYATALIGGVLALYAGLHLRLVPGGAPVRTNGSATGSIAVSARGYDERVFWLAVLVFVGFCGLALLGNARRAGGMAAWLFGARNTVYGDALESGSSALFFVLMTAAQSAVLVYLMIALRQRRWLLAAGLYGLVLGGMLAIFVTRLELVIVLWLPVAYYHYHVRRIPLTAFAVFSVLGLISLSLLNILRGVGLERTQEFLALVTWDDLRTLSGFNRDINVLYPFTILWEMRERGALELEYGMNYLYAFLTFVPRTLWPGKPVTSFEDRYTMLTQGALTGDGGGALIWTFTAWGEGLAQFGVPGVLLNLFLYGLVLRLCRTVALRRPELAIAWLYFTVLAATYLRAGFQSLLIMSLIRIGGATLALHLATRIVPTSLSSRMGVGALTVPRGGLRPAP